MGGLLLVTLTSDAHSLFQWQLCRGMLLREYMVFSHGVLTCKLQEIEAHIFQSGEDRTRKAEMSTCGTPSCSVIRVQAHSRGQVCQASWNNASKGCQTMLRKT